MCGRGNSTVMPPSELRGDAALVSGFLAIVVALLAKGLLYALITFGVIVAVMQIEAHVLQPMVMGRAVSIHQLAAVLGITAGGA